MIKIFTLNKNNKIELSKQELESLLNEAYYEGLGYRGTFTYTSPHDVPYYNITTTTATVNGDSITKGTIKDDPRTILETVR